MDKCSQGPLVKILWAGGYSVAIPLLQAPGSCCLSENLSCNKQTHEKPYTSWLEMLPLCEGSQVHPVVSQCMAKINTSGFPQVKDVGSVGILLQSFNYWGCSWEQIGPRCRSQLSSRHLSSAEVWKVVMPYYRWRGWPAPIAVSQWRGVEGWGKRSGQATQWQGQWYFALTDSFGGRIHVCTMHNTYSIDDMMATWAAGPHRC